MPKSNNISLDAFRQLYDVDELNAFVVKTKNSIQQKNDSQSFQPKRIPHMRVNSSYGFPSSYYLSSK